MKKSDKDEMEKGKNLGFKGAVRLRIFMAIFPCMTEGMLYLHFEKVEMKYIETCCVNFSFFRRDVTELLSCSNSFGFRGWAPFEQMRWYGQISTTSATWPCRKAGHLHDMTKNQELP